MGSLTESARLALGLSSAAGQLSAAAAAAAADSWAAGWRQLRGLGEAGCRRPRIRPLQTERG